MSRCRDPTSALVFWVASSSGRQVEPSRSASARTCRRAASARAGSSAGTPAARAMRVRRREADAEDGRQLVGLLAHDAVRGRAVVLGDPRDEPREAVGRQQQVQRAGRAQGVPRRDGLAGLARVEAGGLERGAGVGIDHVEHVVPVGVEQPLGALAADVAHAFEVGAQRRPAGRRERLRRLDLDLHAEALVVLPDAADRDALARLQVTDQPDQDDLVAVTVGLDDAEACLLGREAHALDRDRVLETGAGFALHTPNSRGRGGLTQRIALRRGPHPVTRHRPGRG